MYLCGLKQKYGCAFCIDRLECSIYCGYTDEHSDNKSIITNCLISGCARKFSQNVTIEDKIYFILRRVWDNVLR